MPLYRLREDDPIATLGELHARPTAARRPRLRQAPALRPLRPAKPRTKRAA
jgi:hypothetical protein